MLKKYCLVFSLLLFLSAFVVAVPVSKVYKVELLVSDGNVSLKDVNLIQGYPNIPGNIFPEDYMVKIISQEDEIYNEFPIKFYFNVFKSVSSECFVSEGIVDTSKCGENSYFEMNDSIYILSIPFSPGAKFLRVYSPSGSLIIERDISEFSCGNFVCDSHESEKSCWKDCAHGKYVFFKVMSWMGAVLFVFVLVVLILLKYHLKQKDIKDKIFYFCRWLKQWQN